MSYILDALKKSEIQRQQGRVPDLTTLPANVGAPVSGVGAGRSPWMVGGAVLALAAVAAGLLLGWQAWRSAGEERPVAPAPVAAPAPGNVQPARVPDPVAVSAPVPAASSAPVVPVPALRAPAEPRARQALVPAEPAPPPPAKPVVVAPTVEEAVPSAAPAPKPLRPAAPPPAPAVAPQSPPVATPAAAPRPAAAAAPAAPPAAAAAASLPPPGDGPPGTPPARVLNFSELPAVLRRNVPPLVVSGFSYAEEPEMRMVVINDRMLREGDEAGPGISVDRIGTEGVILNYQGYRFRPAP